MKPLRQQQVDATPGGVGLPLQVPPLPLPMADEDRMAQRRHAAMSNSLSRRARPGCAGCVARKGDVARWLRTLRRASRRPHRSPAAPR
eukprot:1743848-Heterocapsa_arctica.AAC.1